MTILLLLFLQIVCFKCQTGVRYGLSTRNTMVSKSSHGSYLPGTYRLAEKDNHTNKCKNHKCGKWEIQGNKKTTGILVYSMRLEEASIYHFWENGNWVRLGKRE